MKSQRFLVPTDFSEHSAVVVEHAVDLASRLDAELVLIHVVEPVYFAGAMYGSVYNGPIAMEQVSAAEDAMANLVADLEKRGVVVGGSVASGTPHEIILKEAETAKADMIIMGTHGRSGLGHMLIGSVAEKIVRTAKCPVLTVRTGDQSSKEKVA